MSKVAKSNKGTSFAIPDIAKRISTLVAQGLTLPEIQWELLGGKLISPNMPGTSLEFYDIVNGGIPKISVDILAAVLEIPMTQMAVLLNLSYKTLTRKNRTDLLDPIISSHTFEMSNVIAKGLEVFEDGKRLNRWLQKENRALNGKRPLDLLTSPTGSKLVAQALGRLEEGIYT